MGNSDCENRIEIILRFIRLFNRESTGCLVLDREFMGEEWAKWLKGCEQSHQRASEPRLQIFKYFVMCLIWF